MLALLGLISFSLGLINLLPFLPFDGGHAAVVVYEGIASKIKHRTVRVDYRKLLPVTTVFMVLFVAFAISAHPPRRPRRHRLVTSRSRRLHGFSTACSRRGRERGATGVVT